MTAIKKGDAFRVSKNGKFAGAILRFEKPTKNTCKPS
jgi:hypothetical protein